MIAQYQALGRPITLQRLNLTPAQKLALRDFLRWNEQEENRYYRYDYFRDNCSTRLRDALDHALGGALRAATDTIVTPFTYRRESVRLTDGDASDPDGHRHRARPSRRRAAHDVGVVLHPDAPARRDPRRSRCRSVRMARRVPLVAEERHIAPFPGTTLVPELTTAPRLVWRLLLVGVVLAATLAVIRIMAMSRRGAAWGFALVAMRVVAAVRRDRRDPRARLDGDTARVLGVEREPAAAVAALARARRARAARTPAWTRRASARASWRRPSCCCRRSALLLAIIPGGQENRAIVAMFLPVHLVLAWALALPQVQPPATRAR